MQFYASHMSYFHAMIHFVVNLNIVSCQNCIIIFTLVYYYILFTAVFIVITRLVYYCCKQCWESNYTSSSFRTVFISGKPLIISSTNYLILQNELAWHSIVLNLCLPSSFTILTDFSISLTRLCQMFSLINFIWLAFFATFEQNIANKFKWNYSQIS